MSNEISTVYQFSLFDDYRIGEEIIVNIVESTDQEDSSESGSSGNNYTIELKYAPKQWHVFFIVLDDDEDHTIELLTSFESKKEAILFAKYVFFIQNGDFPFISNGHSSYAGHPDGSRPPVSFPKYGKQIKRKIAQCSVEVGRKPCYAASTVVVVNNDDVYAQSLNSFCIWKIK